MGFFAVLSHLSKAGIGRQMFGDCGLPAPPNSQGASLSCAPAVSGVPKALLAVMRGLRKGCVVSVVRRSDHLTRHPKGHRCAVGAYRRVTQALEYHSLLSAPCWKAIATFGVEAFGLRCTGDGSCARFGQNNKDEVLRLLHRQPITTHWRSM